MFGPLTIPVCISNPNTGYTINNALVLDGVADYLHRTPSVAGNQKTWTWSSWVKRESIGTSAKMLFGSADSAGTTDTSILFISSGALEVRHRATSLYVWRLVTTSLFRDPTAWYHIVVTVDTTQGVAANRVRIHINGVEETSFSTEINPTLNYAACLVNTTTYAHSVGRSGEYAGLYADCCNAEVTFVDGASLTATSFGEFDANGNWQPINPSGLTFGTNGFWLDFADSANPGKDVSSNSVGRTDTDGLSTEFTGATVSFTWSGSPANDIESDASNVAIKSVDTFTGDFDLTWNSLYTTGAQAIGVYAIAEDVTFNSAHNNAGMDSMTNSWWWDGSAVNQAKYGAVIQAAVANGSITFILRRRGSTFYLIRDGSLAHTWTQTSSAEVRIAIGAASTTSNVSNVSWVVNGGNYFTAVSIPTTAIVSDTPSDDAANDVGNYCNWSPLSNAWGGRVLSDGNLNIDGSGTVGNAIYQGSLKPSSGKHFWIVQHNFFGSSTVTGIFTGASMNKTAAASWNAHLETDASGCWLASATGWACRKDGGAIVNIVTSGAVVTDPLCYAVDIDAGKLWMGYYDSSVATYYWADGATGWTGNPVAGTNPTHTFTPGQISPFYLGNTAVATRKAEFGQLGWSDLNGGTLTPPTGFNAINTANMPDPAIPDPSAHFGTALYTGPGTGGFSVTLGGNSALPPDLVWIKRRDALSDHFIYDSVRGINQVLKSNSTAAESTILDSLISFDANGFTVGNNDPGNDIDVLNGTYVAWCWKASVASGFHIKVIPDASMAASLSVAHGNAAGAPEFMIVKQLAAQSWYVWHKDLAGTEYLTLESSAAKGVGGTVFNGVPDATNFTTGSWTGWNTATDFLCLSWVGVEGFSKVGSYTGNGSADGPFVYCGFRPAFVMIKRVDVANQWFMYDTQRDPYNSNNESQLAADTTGAENTGAAYAIDFLSSGFKPRNLNAAINAAGGTLIYIAFAEMPVQAQSRAR